MSIRPIFTSIFIFASQITLTKPDTKSFKWPFGLKVNSVSMRRTVTQKYGEICLDSITLRAHMKIIKDLALISLS